MVAVAVFADGVVSDDGVVAVVVVVVVVVGGGGGGGVGGVHFFLQEASSVFASRPLCVLLFIISINLDS